MPYPHDGLAKTFRLVAVPLGAVDGFTVTFVDIIEATEPDASGEASGDELVRAA